ncbi:PmoA family protein [Maribellus sediminis]|uniref:DUF6807 domain-containing protein n=1 Tax=Maribellus sediminis TaxID=2696285 RepID=UPI0014314621|nr:PmoA family protein [Maribellus sediminis]
MKKYLVLILFLAIIFSSCRLEGLHQKITFHETDQGVEVLEDGQPVLFYQRALKSNGENLFNNYIHPLYSLNGDTLTEEFPADHVYHRGIYWAWHQIYVSGKSIGDGWILENIEQEVTNVTTSKNGQLTINVFWKSPLYEDNKAFLSEETTVTIHPREKNYRAIDFCISLKALVPNVEIGGADNEKGYGGFCTRIKDPEKLEFTSTAGTLIPQDLQVDAGSWIDFSGPIGRNCNLIGLAMLCHPETPNYPESWILRKEPSMQNLVFPGREKIPVPQDQPINLYYRLIIHNGDAQSIDLNELQSEYGQISFKQ